MAYIQNTQANRTVYLTLQDVPATTVAYTDVAVQYKKAGTNTLVTKVLSAGDWLNMGGGVYAINFSASEMDTAGDFTFFLASVKFDNLVYDEFTIEPPTTQIFGMAYIQATQVHRTLYLTLADVPATTVVYTDVTVQYKKSGSTSLVTKVLTSADWLNLGNGVYSITFSASEMDTVGDFTFFLSSAKFDNLVYDEFTIIPATTGPSGILPSQCVVSGTVKDQSALSPRLLKITARPANFPAKAGNNIIASDIMFTYADAYGNFSLPLVRNSVVVIEIERCGIRSQVTIPDSPTANLLDLLPSFVNDYSL